MSMYTSDTGLALSSQISAIVGQVILSSEQCKAELIDLAPS